MIRINGSVGTLYIYDIFGNLITEADTNVNPIQTYIYLGNHRLALISGNFTGTLCGINNGLASTVKSNWAIIIAMPLLIFIAIKYRKKKYVVALVILAAGAIIFIVAKEAKSTYTYGEAIYYYHNDHLGTPQKMTGATRQVVWDAVYQPFGTIAHLTTQGTGFFNDFRFPGQYEDEGTGMYYNINRYYLPNLGRYNRVDPVFNNSFFNRGSLVAKYNYALANPLRYIDPFGLEPSEVVCQKCKSDAIKRLATCISGFAVASEPLTDALVFVCQRDPSGEACAAMEYLEAVTYASFIYGCYQDYRSNLQYCNSQKYCQACYSM